MDSKFASKRYGPKPLKSLVTNYSSRNLQPENERTVPSKVTVFHFSARNRTLVLGKLGLENLGLRSQLIRNKELPPHLPAMKWPLREDIWEIFDRRRETMICACLMRFTRTKSPKLSEPAEGNDPQTQLRRGLKKG
jgi:hypothetical protein